MFALENSSTNVELLQSINKAIIDSKQSSGLFKDFNSISVGADEYSTKYPYLIVIPLEENLIRMFTNGYADVKRTYQFTIRGMKPTQEASFGLVIGLSNNIKQFFSRKSINKDWRLKALRNQKSIVFNVKISDISYDDFVQTHEGVISQSKLTIEFYSQIKTDVIEPIATNELFQTNLKELTKIIYEILNNYKASLLSEVRTLKYGNIEPISFYPAITIIPLRSDLISRFAGADSNVSSHSVYVLTDFNNIPKSIYNNMDIIHKVRDILFANKYLFKRAYDYSLLSIKYGESNLGDVNYFTSQLLVDSSSFEPI
jgi:hypothetical protein